MVRAPVPGFMDRGGQGAIRPSLALPCDARGEISGQSCPSAPVTIREISWIDSTLLTIGDVKMIDAAMEDYEDEYGGTGAH